jgi:adenosylcobinamide-GDP ribazoletransferase
MMAREAQLFLIALQFLTRIRVPAISGFSADWLARSAKYMPLVGALIGAFAAAVTVLAALVLPAPVPIILALAATILLTGALHEDGLADTVDALGGGATAERALEIMKDSRIGTYGTLALIVAFALKATSLAELTPATAACVLIAAHAGARLPAVLALWALPYAGGYNVKVSRTDATMRTGEIVFAVASALVVGLLALPLLAFGLATVAAAAAAIVMALIAKRKIGGYTGDVLGAIEQFFEIAFFIVAAAALAPV